MHKNGLQDWQRNVTGLLSRKGNRSDVPGYRLLADDVAIPEKVLTLLLL
jgi:hypothetical protein